MYKPKPDMKHLELAILCVTDLAAQKDLVAPLDVIANYLEQQLHVKQKVVIDKIGEMERRKLIKPAEMMVEPRRVGYGQSELEKRLIKGYVIDDGGKEKLHLYDIVNHHAFGNSIFPNFDR